LYFEIALINYGKDIPEYKLCIMKFSFHNLFHTPPFKLCIMKFSFHNLFHTPPFLLRNQYSIIYFRNPIFRNTQPPFCKTQEKKSLNHLPIPHALCSQCHQHFNYVVSELKGHRKSCNAPLNPPPPKTTLCTSFYSNIEDKGKFQNLKKLMGCKSVLVGYIKFLAKCDP